MANYTYIENTGVIVPDTAELLHSVEAEYKSVFGEDLDVTPESPQGVLIAAETSARDSVVRNNASLANQINPNLAGGVFLDAICALTGMERRKAEPSIVKALLRGVPHTIVPAGRRAKTLEGDIFYSKKAVVLDTAGKAEVYFYSEVKDAIPCPVNSLVTLLPESQVLGLETITNENPAALGQTVESDSNTRRRRTKTLYLQGVALTGAIISAVYDVDGVRSCIFRENITSEPQLIDGKTLAPHSIWVCVDGGADAAIAKAIFTNKSGGAGYNGAVCVGVTDEQSGQVYPVAFDRCETVQVRARVTVKNLGGGTVDAQILVRDALVAYANGELTTADPEGKAILEGFTVGASVSPFEMAAAINAKAPSLFVVNLEVGLLHDAVLQPVTMPLAIWQKASITHASIEVIGG